MLDDKEVRYAAIYSLGQIGPTAKAALPELKSLAAARDRFVARSAADAIALIEGKAPIPSGEE